MALPTPTLGSLGCSSCTQGCWCLRDQLIASPWGFCSLSCRTGSKAPKRGAPSLGEPRSASALALEGDDATMGVTTHRRPRQPGEASLAALAGQPDDAALSCQALGTGGTVRTLRGHSVGVQRWRGGGTAPNDGGVPRYCTGGPSSPGSPFSPGGPAGPWRPGSPARPGRPASPRAPLGPSLPAEPGGPGGPGLPWLGRDTISANKWLFRLHHPHPGTAGASGSDPGSPQGSW